MTAEEGMSLCRILAASAMRKYRLWPSERDDVLSDAYEGLAVALKRADDTDSTRSGAFIRRYINGYITHGIRSRFRKNLHGAVDNFIEHDMDAFIGANDETKRELWDAVNRLPLKWRMAVVLNLHYGYTQYEVAEMMGVTQMSVSRWVRYGQKELAEGLINA